MKEPIQRARFHEQHPVVLKNMIEGFPNYTPYSWSNSHVVGLGDKLAYVLFFAGATSFNFSRCFLGGEKRPENVRIHTTSIEITPRIESPIAGKPLLWYLLEKAKLNWGGGGAGTNPISYMQAGLHFDLEIEKQMMKAFITFHYLKKEFGVKHSS